ncbi:MAG: VOC family protein [Lapillicoccus sp.]
MTTSTKDADAMQKSTARLAMMTLDCSDPRAEADFWSAVLGWEIAAAEDEYAMLTGPTSALGFGRVPDYEAPVWPNPAGSKQFHFDLSTDDIAAMEARCVELGATVPQDQPGETWRVLLDPAGHPFCLTDAANWG